MVVNSSSLMTFLSYEDWVKDNLLCDEQWYESANVEPWMPSLEKGDLTHHLVPLLFDRDTKRIEPSMHDWLQRSGGEKYWLVALDEIKEITVETLWRGIGQRVFETVTWCALPEYGRRGMVIDEGRRGWIREAGAIEGHNLLVEWFKRETRI